MTLNLPEFPLLLQFPLACMCERQCVSVFVICAWVHADVHVHKKWDSCGRRHHLLRQDKVNMESYTEPTGSRPPEARLIPTDKDREGKGRVCMLAVCV